MPPRRTLAATALSGAAVLDTTPARATVLDPSAYGITASGPITLDGQPFVAWNAGGPVVDVSPGVRDGPLSVSLMAVAAAQHYATAHIAHLRYGDTITITSLTATCVDGHTTVTVIGSAEGVPLRPGMRITLPDGYAEIGATTTHPDGSVTVAGLTLRVGSETLRAAVAHC